MLRTAFFVILCTLGPLAAFGQFKGQPSGKGLTVIVTDGTYGGKDSPLTTGSGGSKSQFKDPIRPLGMEEAIQAGAFLDRPIYGEFGYILVFCVGDSIGGKQGEYEFNGELYKGVYRLIRQKVSPKESIPKSKTSYKLEGLVFFLGISGS